MPASGPAGAVCRWMADGGAEQAAVLDDRIGRPRSHECGCGAARAAGVSAERLPEALRELAASSMQKARCSKAPSTGNLCSPTPGPARCARSMATISASLKPTSPPIPASISPATAAAATRTAITGSPAVSTTSSTSPATASAPPKSKVALVAHPKVSEAAVVGYPHDIKGQGIYAYVTLMAGEQPSEALRKELVHGAHRDRPDRLARS